jgi:integrase
MVLPMPSPYKHPTTSVYWIKQRVPARLLARAKGHLVTVTVDEVPSEVKLGEYIKVSLRTKNAAEAKKRAVEAEAEFSRIWLSFENGPVSLTLRQITALAGEMYHTIRAVLEDDPGEAAQWAQRKRQWDAIEAHRKGSPAAALMIGAPSLEARLGSWVDGALAQKQLRVDEKTRHRCLVEFDRAAGDLALLLERRGKGDFTVDATGERFPAFEAPFKQAAQSSIGGITFDQIIEAEAEFRAPGREAKPLNKDTERKFKTIAAELAQFRGEGGDDATTLTHDDLEGWRQAMLQAAQLKNRTIANKLITVKTIVGWGRERFKGAAREQLRAVARDIEDVKVPDFTRKSSHLSSVWPDEALAILRIARKETDPRLRWLPWICAYTGLRISEASAIEKGDLFSVEGHWFIDVDSAGKRSLKTLSAHRRIPIHPALEREGFVEFVQNARTTKLFSSGADTAVRRWVRGTVGIVREELSPNHGWRHLFVDLCIRDGVSDAARLYIQGRESGTSEDGYGRSVARLPGLWREIATVEPYPVD